MFTTLGLRCGHEEVFKPDEARIWESDLPGEASWLAAPFLPELDDDVLVLHQRRDRLQSALSLVRHGFFSEGDIYRRYAENWVPTGYGEAVDKALLFHDAWHALIEQGLRGRPHIGYQVEHLDEDLLRRICGFLGWIPSPAKIYSALRTDRSLHTNRQEEATWPFRGSSL